MFRIVAILSLVFSVSCATQSKGTHKSKTAKIKKYKKHIKRLETNLNKQAMIVKQLREQNERLRLGSRSSNEINDNRIKDRERTATSFGKDLGESKLFGTFLAAHNSNRRKKAARAFYLLEKTFPNSPLLAEAIYLQGKRYLETKYYKAALKKMNRIIDEFATHSRARSAMLAKSVIYRRLSLMKPSKSVLRELISKYPKSDEARKAQSHLALIDSASERK